MRWNTSRNHIYNLYQLRNHHILEYIRLPSYIIIRLYGIIFDTLIVFKSIFMFSERHYDTTHGVFCCLWVRYSAEPLSFHNWFWLSIRTITRFNVRIIFIRNKNHVHIHCSTYMQTSFSNEYCNSWVTSITVGHYMEGMLLNGKIMMLGKKLECSKQRCC